MSVVKRSYSSPYRHERGRQLAESTTQRVAGAARRLFAANGYAATTIAAIAREAGVAVQTVYANFASKRDILRAVTKVAAMPDDDQLFATFESAGARDRLSLGVTYLRRHMELASDIDRIVHGAASAEPQIAEDWRTGEGKRRQHARREAAALASEGELQPGISELEAADILHVLSIPEVYETLVSGSGWKPEEYERWLLMTLEALLTGARTRPSLGPDGS